MTRANLGGVTRRFVNSIMRARAQQTQPTDELYIDGRSVSPRDWLLAGNPPAPVNDLVAQLYAW